MRNVTSVILLSAVLLVSCIKEITPVNPKIEVLLPERQITLIAVGEQDTSTKTVRDESDGSVWWTPGDAISVFSPTNNKLVCNATENSRTASFSGSIQDTSSNNTNVGEIVNASGIGVVAWVSDDGKTALLLSASELQGKNWTTSNDWCGSYGDGWRMPTIDELTLIHGNFSAINAGLKSSGYTQLTTANKCYWSSTVNPTNSNYYYRERVHDGTIFTSTGGDEKVSSTANYTRAVKTVLLNSTSLNSEPSYTGLYPYDKNATFDGSSVTMTVIGTQTATPGSFATGLFPALGKSEGSYIKFYNICGGLRFSVTKEGIHTIELKGNNGEIIAGKIKVGFSSDGVPEVKEVLEGSETICLKAPDDGCFEIGKNYYFVVLPTLFTNGFTLTFSNQTSTGKYNRTAQTAVKRSVFSGLSNVDGNVVIGNNDAVDLGLSVKWASYNLGAESPEGYGDYYAWGETEPYYENGYAQSDSPLWKDGKGNYGYEWPTYKWGTGTNSYLGPYIKYNTNSRYGEIDNKTVLDLDDDAANVTLGAGWRLPTAQEINELKNANNCNWTWTEINGVKGMKITSKKSGYEDKWIFLPASGNRTGTSISGLNNSGAYWSSSLHNNYPSNAYSINFSSSISSENNNGRCNGRSIRPVYESIFGISLDLSEFSLPINSTKQLNAIVSPPGAASTAVSWTSSNTSVATVNQNGLVTARGPGQATITVTTVNGKNASCLVTVLPFTAPAIIIEPTELSLSEGDSALLRFSIFTTDAENQIVVWSSNNPSIASVDSDGRVYAHSVGVATITVATADGKLEASCFVTVVKAFSISGDNENLNFDYD